VISRSAPPAALRSVRTSFGAKASSIDVSVIEACSVAQPGNPSPKMRWTSSGPTWSHQLTSRTFDVSW
jgi:hypothetical protein